MAVLVRTGVSTNQSSRANTSTTCTSSGACVLRVKPDTQDEVTFELQSSHFLNGFSFVVSKDEQKWPKWSKVIEFSVPRVMAAGQMYLVAQNWYGISLVYTGIYLYQYIPIFIYLQLYIDACKGHVGRSHKCIWSD